MLYEYLKENYECYEPIFTVNIEISMNKNTLRSSLKSLCDEGKLCRYDSGIFYLPGNELLKGLVPLSPSIVAKNKYIMQKNKVKGYYSGHTFANQIGISLQVPYIQEIVSNEASAKVREIDIKGQQFILRKPKVFVTETNYQTLQLLDLINDLDKYVDSFTDEMIDTIKLLIKEENITKCDIDQYIKYYPNKIYKNLYETGLVYAIT